MFAAALAGSFWSPSPLTFVDRLFSVECLCLGVGGVWVGVGRLVAALASLALMVRGGTVLLHACVRLHHGASSSDARHDSGFMLSAWHVG